MELEQILHDFAAGMEAADKRRPQASSSSTAGRFYQPGIGPFRETEAVALTLAELRAARGGVYAHAGKRRYPATGSLLIRDVEVQAVACRDRVDQGLQRRWRGRLRPCGPPALQRDPWGKPGADCAQRPGPGWCRRG